jgi:hypothetical protein
VVGLLETVSFRICDCVSPSEEMFTQSSVAKVKRDSHLHWTCPLFPLSTLYSTPHSERAVTTRCATPAKSLGQSARSPPRLTRQENRYGLFWSPCQPHSQNASTMRTSTPVSAPHVPTAPAQTTEMPSHASDPPRHHDLRASDASAAPHYHHALEIPEVLENILIRLPILDLFILQRVSKSFQAIMAKSPSIQRKMFLKLSDTPQEYWRYVCEYKRAKGCNYLTKLAFAVADPTTTTARHGGLTTPVTLNPLLKVFSTSTRSQKTGIRGKYLNFSCHAHIRLEAPKQSVVGQDSSLLDMYISDPPCKVAKVSVTLTIRPARTSKLPQYQPHRLCSEVLTVQLESGLTLGDLWDEAIDAPGDYHLECQYGILRSTPVARLRDVLTKLRESSVVLSGTLDIELSDVVVPTAEEWEAVR